jgi:oligoribonuclease
MPRESTDANGSNGCADRHDRLVWFDLEMTGLEVETDVIVEIGCLVTDAQLVPLDDGIDIVVHQSAATMERMSDFVREMHTRSGLLAEIEASTVDLTTAGAEVLAYISHHVPEPRSAPLCGNSIGMDRRFVSRYLPEIDAHLHYRDIDVSSLKELCRRWYPALFRKRPDKAETHRALGDVLESLAELRYYREVMMIDPVTRPSGAATG